MIDILRRQADELSINVDFIDPPGVPFEEVNWLMNQARIGVVSGVDDGAPAISTEHMLAGIPVRSQSKLRCGLQYITPRTGLSWLRQSTFMKRNPRHAGTASRRSAPREVVSAKLDGATYHPETEAHYFSLLDGPIGSRGNFCADLEFAGTSITRCSNEYAQFCPGTVGPHCIPRRASNLASRI